MKRYERVPLVITPDGSEMAPLDDLTLAWVYSQLYLYRDEEESLERSAEEADQERMAAKHMYTARALDAAARRLAVRAADLRNVR